jgi:heat shock protein HtpX
LLLIAGFVLVVAVVVFVVLLLVGLGVLGLLIALIVAGVAAFVAYWKSDAVALRMSHARPADADQYPRLHNVVEGLCIAAGLPKPRVYVIDDPAPNALAAGRSPRHGAIAVTTGLLDKMNRIELEAVLAHELNHIKNYDVLPSTVAVALVGLPSVVVPPVFGPVMHLAINDRREAEADLNGVSLTRYPPGLVSALEKLEADPTVVHFHSRAIAHLWIEQPPLDERIKVLKEL